MAASMCIRKQTSISWFKSHIPCDTVHEWTAMYWAIYPSF